MKLVELSETVCLAQEENRCAIELLYIRYKPFVENSVRHRKLIERVNDASLEQEDVVHDILSESIHAGIDNFDIEKFMNSKKRDVDHYFHTLINFTFSMWLRSQMSWKHTPHYRDTFSGNLDHIKTFRYSLVTHEIGDEEKTYIPGTYYANNIAKLAYEDNTYQYKVLKELVVEKAIYLLDKFFSKLVRYKEGYWALKRTKFHLLDKHKIVSLLEMKYSGHVQREIVEEMGILLNELICFYRWVIKPAVLLVFDEAGYYEHYMKSLCNDSLGIIRKEKGKEFVDGCLSMI